LSVLCDSDRVCPRFVRLNRHNQLLEVRALNTPKKDIRREILDCIAYGR